MLKERINWTTGLNIAILITLLLGAMAMINGITIRSLWLDESFFARNVAQFPDGYFNQSAPTAPLFYVISWLLTQILGKVELAYRLLPLLAALGSVALLGRFLIQRYSRFTAFIAVVLMMTCYSFSHHAAFAHAYTMDLFFGALLLIQSDKVLNTSSMRQRWLWLLYCILAILGSMPGIFIVGANCLALLAVPLFEKDREKFKLNFRFVLPVGLSAFLMTAGLYFAMTVERTDMFYWDRYFPAGLMPWTIGKWFLDSTAGLTGYFFWNSTNGLLGLFLIFAGTAWFVNTNKSKLALLCWLPMAITILAAVIQKYPWGGVRTAIFTFPYVLILLASGLELLWRLSWSRFSRMIVAVAFLAITVPSIWVLKKAVIPVHDGTEAIKTLRSHMESEMQDGDSYLIYYAAKTQFEFYFPALTEKAIYQGWHERGEAELQSQFIQTNLENHTGRCWLIFSHVEQPEEELYMVDQAWSWGTVIDTIEASGCSAYLWSDTVKTE